MDQQTLLYYDLNAARFTADTLGCDFHTLQDRFLSRLKKGARILDLGCGPGRDSRYFLEKGFDVTPLDGSIELCRIAETVTGKKAVNLDFRKLSYSNAFDGIWACASLLHLAAEELPVVMQKCLDALRVNGLFYCSFKLGEFSGYRNGRFFTDMTKTSLTALLDSLPNAKLLELFVTGDVRPDRENEQWLNAFILKEPDRIG